MKMVPAPPPMTSSPIMSSSSHQQFQVTEDTPVDFLEGCMEILVVFPNEKSILMSIQRRMPMLDLLIHVTAANKISPAAHLLQVTDEEGRLLPHKPSTPIGSLNAHKVYIVAKNRLMADRSGGRSTNAKSSSASQFEQSFRVQVRLPRNQLFVTRVTGRTQLADLLHTVCNEKALDPRHYELRHPVNLDERLRLNSCLDDYKLQEVVLVPVCGKSSATLLTPAVSVSDLSSPSNSMNRKTATVTASNSKMSGKSTLKPTTSEAALAGLEKKKRGLLGLLGFGKHKKGSSMGDSSISSDSAGDRSISPSRSEEPAPPPPVVEPVAPTPPSPVLFSKRLAEEAVAKRNSRLMLSQMSTEASTTTTTTSPNDAPPLRKTISTTSNGVAAAASSAPTKPGAKKKRAPAPPQPQSSLNGMNEPPKAASEVSTYSTSSSGSNYVSPSTSVIHHSEEEVVLRSPSPKLSYLRQESNNVARQRQSDSGCSSPVRSPRSNLITTPGNSSSNLTQVSSTSNASLASVFKKRKAPVPPPALEEQVETSDKLPPATPVVVVVVNGGSHDDSDRASSVSDQLSSVSDVSSTRKSAPTPDIIEPPIVVQLTPQHHQPSSDLDSPRSSEGDSSNATSERPANSVSSEDDYELLNYRREKIEPAIVEKNGPFSEAHEKEEVVVSEPIYTMVIKSPRPLVAVNVGPEKDDKSGQTNGDVHVDEPDRMEVKASPIPAEEGPEMERDAGDGQTESPIMWEYKLPAPPTPFQDSIQSPLDKLQIASESDSSRSRRSSMSTDSLQHNRSAEEDLVKDSPRSSIGSQEEPVAAPQVVPKISIKEDCDTNEDAIKLDLGAELQGESATEEPAVNGPPVEEVLKVVVMEEKVVVLQSSDPEAKPYGVESTTDEPLSLEPTSLPPVPSTLPPCESDDDSIGGQPDMRFSIATYTVRVNKDSTYEKKLARSGSPEELTKVQIEPVAVPEKKVDDPLPLVAETKEPETIADPVKTDENSGSSSAAVPPAAQLPLPMLNADFIQQFQNALHSITDPKARALQEEFLRLQQQFLTLQMQAAVQQNVTPVSTESTSVAAHCETIKVEDKVVEIDVPKVLDPPIEFSVESDSKQILPVESPVEKPVEIPLKTIDPIENQLQKEQIEVEPEATVYRYAGPPQVKLDTWKPGRPRSEVIDFSRSSSFNVPLAPVEKKIDLPVKNTPAPTVAAMESPASPTVATIPEEVVVVPAQLPKIAEEESKIKSIVIVPEVEETLDVREKIEHIESSSNNSSSSTSPVPKPVVLRKSSFMTARPFEARPVSMPIKRPNFTPMVIQPVPFVFGKIRAPEVRGFASLPPDNRSEMQSIRTTGSAGIAPFSAVNKPRPVSTVSKENPTVVIRNKLIESARRPSAELNGIPIKLEDSSDQLEKEVKEVKESVPIVSETRRASNSSRPLSMPMSSSLLLAAGAGGAVNKPQPVVSEISIQPISSTAQPSVVSGADPTSISGRRSLSSKFVRKVDPREELLNSIRSFANGGSLKKTGTSLEK